MNEKVCSRYSLTLYRSNYIFALGFVIVPERRYDIKTLKEKPNGLKRSEISEIL